MPQEIIGPLLSIGAALELPVIGYAYQQVEPLRAGKELVRFPKVLISLIIGDDVF